MVAVKMPAPGAHTRDYENWAQANGRAQFASTTVLKDAVIGIEARHFLQKLLATDLKEPLVCALGGFPFGLADVVEREVAAMRAAGFIPLFVFSGCAIQTRDKPFTTPDEGSQQRSHAWSLYDKGLGAEAVDAFGETGIISPIELYRPFMELLYRNNVEFQVAPYASWPQLVYLQQKGVVDAIYGDFELLLFDVDKMIVNLNLQSNKFSWVERARLLRDEKITNEQLIDAMILTGTQLCRPYPPLDGHSFPEALSLMKRFGSVANMLKSQPDTHPDYLDKYRRTRAAIKHHVIITDDGRIEPLNSPDTPHDVHEFIGQRLPEELYFYLSRGIIGPQVLDMLATGELEQAAPLDSGDAEEYRKLLDGLNTMRTESLSLLAKSLHRYWMNKEVKVYNWYDSKSPKTLVHKEIPHPSELAQKWNVREGVYGAAIEKYENQIDGPAASLAAAVCCLSSAEFASQTLTPKNPDKLLKTSEEIRMNTLWRMLQMRGFIDGQTHTLTPWGRALNAALMILGGGDEGIVQATYLAFELFRMKALKPENFAPGMSGAPVRGSAEDNANIILISQVCSLLPITHAAAGYSGPLSRHTLAFNSFARSLTRELRSFAEMTLVNLLMAGDADRSDDFDWAELGLKLPFITEVNACLGIAVKTYLHELCAGDDGADPTALETRQAQKKKLTPMFSNAKNVIEDVEWAFMFWSAIRTGVKQLENEGVMPAEVKAFLAADEWLDKRN